MATNITDHKVGGGGVEILAHHPSSVRRPSKLAQAVTTTRLYLECASVEPRLGQYIGIGQNITFHIISNSSFVSLHMVRRCVI
jgi:hypothetical protein